MAQDTKDSKPRQDPTDDMVQKFKVQSFEEDEEFEKSPNKPIVDWFQFNLAMGFVILINAVTIGLETDEAAQGKSSAIWYVTEVAFTAIFVAELYARLHFHRIDFLFSVPYRILPGLQKIGAFRWCLIIVSYLNVWNLIDVVVVVFSVLDAFVLGPMNVGGDLRMVQMVRFARLLRLTRLLKLFKLFSELYLVACGLVKSLRVVSWVCIIMVVLCYIGGTFTTVAIGHNEDYRLYFERSGWDHEIYFGTVARSMLTFAQIMSMDDQFDGVIRHVCEVQPEMVFFFSCFNLLGSIGLMTVIVGVVVEATINTSAKDEHAEKKRKERDRLFVINQLRSIFETADTDHSGTLDLFEVEAAFREPDIAYKLRMIDFPADDPAMIFNMLDYSGDGELTIEEFIAGCMRMKGVAKSSDLLWAQVATSTLKKHAENFEEELFNLTAKIDMIMRTVKHINIQGEHTFLNAQEYRLKHPDDEMVPPTDGELMSAPWFSPKRQAPKAARRFFALEDGDVKSQDSPSKRPKAEMGEAMVTFDESQTVTLPEAPPRQPLMTQNARTFLAPPVDAIEDMQAPPANAIQDGSPTDAPAQSRRAPPTQLPGAIEDGAA